MKNSWRKRNFITTYMHHNLNNLVPLRFLQTRVGSDSNMQIHSKEHMQKRKFYFLQKSVILLQNKTVKKLREDF